MGGQDQQIQPVKVSRPPVPPPFRESVRSFLPRRFSSSGSSGEPPLPPLPPSRSYQQPPTTSPPAIPERRCTSSLDYGDAGDWSRLRPTRTGSSESLRRASTTGLERSESPSSGKSWWRGGERRSSLATLNSSAWEEDALEFSDPFKSSPSPPLTLITSTAPPLPKRPPPPPPPISSSSPSPPFDRLLLESPTVANFPVNKGKLREGGETLYNDQDRFEDNDQDRFEVQARAMIEEEMQRLLAAHDEDMFLLRNSTSSEAPNKSYAIAPPAVTPPTPELEEVELFSASYPPLPPSPAPSPFNTPQRSTLSTPLPSVFTAQLQHVASILVWRLKRLTDARIECGEAILRKERRAAKEEMFAVEEELDELKEMTRSMKSRLQALETDNLRLRDEMKVTSVKHQQQIGALKTELHESALGHSEDLESASRNAVLLQERIEVLQAALNDPDRDDGARGRGGGSGMGGNNGTPDEENFWVEIVNSQTEELATHTAVLQSLSSHLSCSVCTALMRGATTLSCGHSGCQECFQSWFDSAQGGRSCPECRVVTNGSLAPAWALREVVNGLKKIGLEEE